MNALQVIFVALICLALLVVIVWQGTKIYYAIKTKGETLRERPKDKQINDKGGKEE